MIYNPKHETMSRDDLAQIQIERLQAMLNRVYRAVEFYHKKFDQLGISVDNIRSLDDLQKLPFTTRDDLRASSPYGMFAVPLHDIVRIHATSGSTGKPIAVGYTKNDLSHWSELVARQLAAAGLNEHDIVQVAFNYSLFTGGLGFHYGAERLGAAVIPASSGRNVREQITVMKDYKATALVALPSFALAIARSLQEQNINPESLQLKCGMFGGEPWSESLRKKLESMLGLTAFDTYGLSEVIGPGVAAECQEHNGLHINEDHFIVEIIDPVTLRPVSPGQEGELVFTTITKEGFPVIRYRTRDLARILDGSCACGRTSVRMSRVSGRSDDMILTRGMKIFPSQIRESIAGFPELLPHCKIIIETKDDVDDVEIQVSLSEKAEGMDEVKSIQKLRAGIIEHLETTLGISAKIAFVEPESLDGIGEGKKSVKVERK
jgi:phenylacetate-CoA ligase